MANTDIKILSNLDLFKNDIYNANKLAGNNDNSSISFEKDNEKDILALKTSNNADMSAISTVAISDTEISQNSANILLTATDASNSSNLTVSSDSININSTNITMSHPNQTSSEIQFTWDGENNILTIGKKNKVVVN